MTAWARMQFTEMSAAEFQATKQALLRYCELDTLAMVWIMEEFIERAKNSEGLLEITPTDYKRMANG